MKIKEINALTWCYVFVSTIVIIVLVVTPILINKERAVNPTSSEVYISDYCVVESAGAHFVANNCKITATNIRKIP